jgi:hypothetical protein
MRFDDSERTSVNHGSDVPNCIHVFNVGFEIQRFNGLRSKRWFELSAPLVKGRTSPPLD